MAKMSQKCSGIKYIKQPQPNKPKKSANSHSGQASVYGSNNLTHSKWPFLVAESLSWKPQGSLKSTIYEQIKYSGKIQQLVKIIVLDHQTLHNSAKKINDHVVPKLFQTKRWKCRWFRMRDILISTDMPHHATIFSVQFDFWMPRSRVHSRERLYLPTPLETSNPIS